MLHQSLEDLVQCPDPTMPYNVDDPEDLDEDILSTFLNPPHLPSATQEPEHQSNAVTKVDLEVCTEDIFPTRISSQTLTRRLEHRGGRPAILG